MANASKRKISYSIPSESMSSRPKTIPDLLNEVTSSQRKRRRISLAKTENESSTDSFSLSNCVPSDSEGSSDSEFEEHPYSRTVPSSSKRFERTRSRPKSNSNIHISELETDLRGIKRSKCTSKNAMMARLNRLKKKKYIEDLENKNAELEAENQMLKRMLDIRVKEMESLKKKALNLENVIRNSTEIGSLLKCVRQHTDLEISSSLLRSESTSSLANKEATAEKPTTSRDFHEFEVSSIEEEGKEILRFNSKSVSSPLGFLDINSDADVDFDISNPILSDVDSWIKPNCFDLPELPELTGYDCTNMSPSRCETPSKGFATCASKNLFGDVGVCFHIANNKVSLEFCDSCNQMASL